MEELYFSININVRLKIAGGVLPAEKLLNVKFLLSVTYPEKAEF